MGLYLGNGPRWVCDPGMGPSGHPGALGMVLYPRDGPQGCPEAPGMGFHLRDSPGTIPDARGVALCCLFALLWLLLGHSLLLAQAMSLVEPVTINFCN